MKHIYVVEVILKIFEYIVDEANDWVCWWLLEVMVLTMKEVRNKEGMEENKK